MRQQHEAYEKEKGKDKNRQFAGYVASSKWRPKHPRQRSHSREGLISRRLSRSASSAEDLIVAVQVP